MLCAMPVRLMRVASVLRGCELCADLMRGPSWDEARTRRGWWHRKASDGRGRVGTTYYPSTHTPLSQTDLSLQTKSNTHTYAILLTPIVPFSRRFLFAEQFMHPDCTKENLHKSGRSVQNPINPKRTISSRLRHEIVTKNRGVN